MAELVGGALLGGVVSELLQEVIKVAKMAYRCKKNCGVLITTLESISPLLDRVAKSIDNSNVTCQAWLGSMEVLLIEAKSIVEKCSLKKSWSGFVFVKRSKLSMQIVEIDNQIMKRLPIANLITLDIVQGIHSHMMVNTLSSNVDVGDGSNVNIQDTPSKIVPFVANPFEKLKKVIMDDGREMDAPMTIGLKGRGGAGKTLLAKMINNDEDIRRKFTTNSILWITIGRDAKVSSIYSTMAKLIQDDDVYEQDLKQRNLEDQRRYMLTLFKEKKILLILDDVWDCYPARNCAMMEWLDVAKGIGSITLVTTREMAVLNCGKAKAIVEVESLSKEDSWKLFCIHAFGNMKPASVVIEGITKEVCEECDGLPLAIKVIGSAMYEKDDEEEWQKTLKCLKGLTSMSHIKSVERELEHKLYNRLKYSYEELDEVSKKCFLYFAAFPEDYEMKTKQLYSIWHVEGFFSSLNEEESNSMGQDVLIDLTDRSLVDLSKNGDVVMIHDVLRDLAIRILGHAKPLEWAYECFFKPKRLMGAFANIEKTVKRVSLIGCKIEEFPSNLELPCLEVCLLSSIESITDNKESTIPKGLFSSMKALLMLDLSKAFNMQRNPQNFGGLKSVAYLDMSKYSCLKKILESIGELKALTHLDLSECECLMEVPKSIGELKALTHLDLSKCSFLKKAPENIGELKALTHLDLSWCKLLKEVPKSIGALNALKHLDLSFCSSLKDIPESIGDLKTLTRLDLFWCRTLKKIPKSIEELKALTHLDLSDCVSLMELPKNIGKLKALKHLDVRGCRSLKEILENIGELKALMHLNLSGWNFLKDIPKSIGELKDLEYLSLSGCISLKDIPTNIGNLKALTHLGLSWCESLVNVPKNLGELKTLMHLNLRECGSLEEVPESIGE